MQNLSLGHQRLLFQLQIFNELNARKIHDQYNILAGITESRIFGIVLVTTIGLQILIMETPLRIFFKVEYLVSMSILLQNSQAKASVICVLLVS